MTLLRDRGARLAVVALAVGAVLLALVIALPLALERADESGSRQGAQEPPAFEHLQAFQSLADEHGDRAAGTPGYEAAARYVEEQLESAGYRSARQYFTFDDHGDEIESFNIVAETDGGSDDNVIMIGAHLDGVGNSPAINDNASGSAALLETAKEISEQGDVHNTVRFVWWGAEEFPNSPGSAHYVEDLAQSTDGAIDRIAAYLNLDMVASPNYIIGVYDARAGTLGFDGSGLDVPDGSMEVMEVFTDYFDFRDQAWVATDWNFDSDQVAFIEAGVAVGGLFTGASEEKSERQARLFGGTAGQPRDPNYHTAGDDIDNVSPEALDIMTNVITHAAITLAEDDAALQ